MFGTGGVDFDSAGAVFTFNASSETMYSFNVSLVDDNVYEFIENFTARLTFVEAADRVTIDPGSAQVQILDDDGKLLIIITYFWCLFIVTVWEFP